MTPRPLRYLALGDSYTIGEGVPESERWPEVLAGLLRAGGLDIAGPEVIAQTGWTTDELLAAVDARQPEGPYDLVTVQVGVNDQYRGRGRGEFAVSFAAVLDRAIALAGGDAWHVVVVSIPDWSVTPFAEGRDRAAIREALDDFNLIEFGVLVSREFPHYANVTPSSEAMGTDPSLVAADGLHPSGKLHAAWAELVSHSANHLLRHGPPPPPAEEELDQVAQLFKGAEPGRN
ncbi:MAG: SGNH/GDSL hydrolase family protein [Chloroflexi bacterium]|nr:SGNH/GDSL hydrolase family protein [Chloroflexota bacterium]